MGYSLASLRQIAALFLKLGAISFGGPAVHIALMEEETVVRRNWLTRQQFLDLLGATHLIPGPNALEMTAHVGYLRGGIWGLAVAPICFTLPAALITVAFAWAYTEYGATPTAAPLLQGIKPAVLAVLIATAWRLSKTALRSPGLAVLGLAVAGASLAGVNEILTLVIGSTAGAVILPWLPRRSDKNVRGTGAALGGIIAIGGSANARAAEIGIVAGCAGVAGSLTVSAWQLALFFLKVGAVLYGSGYVLIAYLHGGLVTEYGWLTESQLQDAVAIGQFTPGPLITTATFVGYLLAGGTGAAAATIAIVLPGLLLVAITHPWIPRLRTWRWTGGGLDAVGAASIGLMAAVTFAFARTTLADWKSVLIALASAFVLLRWKLAPAWLILAGAAAGTLLW